MRKIEAIVNGPERRNLLTKEEVMRVKKIIRKYI